ncbi:MAG: hypothetical protein H0W87_10430 [Actinobacteria bacterium]|nr:hypothetical protein [Actinomycetota bacterium]
MARDDWRLRVELEEERHATDFLARLGLDLGSEARELAKELKAHRLAVSNDADTVFVYGATRDAVRQAKPIVEAELKELGLRVREIEIEHWLHEEDRWDDEPPGPDLEEELLEEGYAPWEVRVECESVDAARELADQLEREGYGVVRRFRYVIAGTAAKEDAEELAARVHGKVEPGGELVYEVTPQNPFAIFGGLGT